MIDGPLAVTIKDMLLVVRQHGYRISRSRWSVGVLRPVVVKKRSTRFPPVVGKDVVNGPLAVPIKDMLLMVGQHGYRIARGSRCVRILGPDVVEKRSMQVPTIIGEDMVDGALAVAVKDMLLMVGQHGYRIARGRRSAGFLGPVITKELITRFIKKYMKDSPFAVPIEDVLLVGRHHCGQVAYGRRVGLFGPLIVKKPMASFIEEDVVDRSLAVAIEHVLLRCIRTGTASLIEGRCLVGRGEGTHEKRSREHYETTECWHTAPWNIFNSNTPGNAENRGPW